MRDCLWLCWYELFNGTVTLAQPPPPCSTFACGLRIGCDLSVAQAPLSRLQNPHNRFWGSAPASTPMVWVRPFDIFLLMHLGRCSWWVLMIKSALKELKPVGSRWDSNQWYHRLVYVRFQWSVSLFLHWKCLLSQSAFMFLSTVKINKSTPRPLVWEFLMTIITSGGEQTWLEKN